MPARNHSHAIRITHLYTATLLNDFLLMYHDKPTNKPTAAGFPCLNATNQNSLHTYEIKSTANKFLQTLLHLAIA